LYRKFKSFSVAAGTLFRRRLLFASYVLAACAFFVHPFAGASYARGAQETAASKSRIIIASGARVRAEPGASAGEVGRLQLGVVVRELERSGSREKVGAAEDYWYRVSAPGGVEGWVFGGLTAPFDEGRRIEIYRKLAGDRLKAEEPSFADSTDLVAFLERAVTETKQAGERGELELLRLLALHKSLAAIQLEKQSELPFQAWTKKYEAQIVYSEPAGQWFVRSDLLWDLQKKYGGLPLSERIAWEAAQIPLPGECEGYLPCYVYLYTVTEGRYLNLYPRGAHAAEALDNISESLAGTLQSLAAPDSPYHVPPEDRVSFRRSLAELRAQLSRASHPKRALALRQIDELARRFR
jgi:hypothetical protein